MATYDNPRTEVVHWISGPHARTNARTACHFLDSGKASWNPLNYDPLGMPGDVTCCHCRETAAWLATSQKAFDAAVRDGTKARCFRLSCDAEGE